MKVVIEADGGSRGNPGPAGYGAVVFAADTRAVLAERGEGIGVATNNVAEFGGRLQACDQAPVLGADEVQVQMDSKLVVEQMMGRWQVKHPAMQPLAARARELMRAFRDVDFTWIPRERNKHADRLANEAMDRQAGIEPKVAPKAAEAAPATAPSWTGAQGEPTRLLLLRHGQTAMSAERRYSGRGDVPLTDIGELQAEAAATRVAKMIDASTPIVASPLTRTLRTAEALAAASGGEVTVNQGIIETDFGDWEGLTFTEASAKDQGLHSRWLSDTSIPAPGGESMDAVHRRVRKARDEIIARHGGTTIVVVSHVTPIKSLLRMGLDVGPSLLFRLHLDLASLSIVEFYPDGYASVRLVNDTSHLAD